MRPVEGRDPFGLVGATIGGRYHIEAFVEETALSVVYRAVHRVWCRHVAIKAFKAPPLGEEARRELLAAFVREGAVLAELSERTAAICQARDVASLTTASGEWVPYMVLEWLEGEPLDILLAREQSEGRKPRGVDEALRMLAPVARGLTVAHERGIVHRDVKPGNIFVLADGADRSMGPTKLLDFGIAAAARGAVSIAGGAEGAAPDSFTPAYGAPEQFSAQQGTIGPWTDIFALALVFVELVAGREALQGDSLAALAASACHPAWRPTPRTLGVPVSDGVEEVLARALAVRPEDRYPRMGVFWPALARAAQASRVDLRATLPIPLVRRRGARSVVNPGS
jgi:serine/threonine protein kinase